MNDLWIATGNPKKRIELDRLLGPLGYRLRLASEAAGPFEVVEDQKDFAGNARKKASTLSLLVSGLAVGDDSGLCVDALSGRPGVLSARYAGEDASDTDRIDKLLAELHGISAEQRTARFVCSICLTGPDGRVLATFEDSCEGVIRLSSRGDLGFGYDPVFVPREFLGSSTDSETDGDIETAGKTQGDTDRTFAELDPSQKDSISHRGKALRQLAAWLQENDL